MCQFTLSNLSQLIRYQLDSDVDGSGAEGGDSYLGLSFGDFYRRCRDDFLVNSDLTLRAQLTEFHDHKLVITRKSATAGDGVEYLAIPLAKETLKEFLEMQEAAEKDMY